ncbi:MAG: HAD hydrolase-like protein, partial [Brooklawnia sp.]
SVKCSASFGKPDPIMTRLALEGLDLPPEDCVMVGDRLQTDIQMAIDSNMASALVLTGEATADDVRALDAAHTPSFILDRIDRLIPASAWAELGWTETDD